jgi:hypothetical protein
VRLQLLAHYLDLSASIDRFVRQQGVEAGFVVEHASEGKTGLHMAVTSCYETAVIGYHAARVGSRELGGD